MLDIGANIGAEGIPLARKVKHVYCVEPLMTEILHQNITMNSVKNITVLECGLGPSIRVEKIQYDTRVKKVNLFPFQWFLMRAGGHVDYLCCDCEGPEWNIDIKDCEGIRAFWIEFHIRRGHEKEDNRKMTDWLIWWHKKNYEVECSRNPIGRGEEFKDCYHVYAHPKEE